MAKLLFLQNIQYEFVGPTYISAMLKRGGHDCRVLIGNSVPEFNKTIVEYQPDLIGFSIMSPSAEWANGMGSQIKKKYGLPTIFGGSHPTFYPEYVNNDGVDMVIRGEGDDAMLEVMNCIEEKTDFGAIGNLIYKKNGSIIENRIRDLNPDLDVYPFPDRRLYESEFKRHNIDMSVRNVITSRGCPFSCTFCQTVTLRELYKGKGNYIRIRKKEKVLEELELLKNSTNTGSFYILDDIFGLDFEWLKEFLTLYKQRVGIEFSCLVRADAVRRHEDFARLLKDAGCRMVAFGIESGSERIRNKLLNKRISNEDIRVAASRFHEAGIKFRAFNIMALPGETLEEAFETVQLNIDIRTDYPWCAIYMPFKDTALTNYALSEKLLSQNYFSSFHNSSFFSSSSPLQAKAIKRIVNMHRFFQTAVWWPWTFPIVKLLIKLPPNLIFNLWFGFIFYLSYIKSEERNWWRTFLFALRNYLWLVKK